MPKRPLPLYYYTVDRKQRSSMLADADRMDIQVASSKRYSSFFLQVLQTRRSAFLPPELSPSTVHNQQWHCGVTSTSIIEGRPLAGDLC